MLLLEYKIKKFLEDKSNIKENLLKEFEELNRIDNLLRMAGCLTVNRHKKWIHRAKYKIKNSNFQGVSQVSWEKILVGKK